MIKGAFWFFADSRVWVEIVGERTDIDVLTAQQVGALFPLDSRN
jgi:hypothetical protein